MPTSPLTTVDGPKGKAELIEVIETLAGGVQDIHYAVKHDGKTYPYRTLGEAYIAAGELAGTKT